MLLRSSSTPILNSIKSSSSSSCLHSHESPTNFAYQSSGLHRTRSESSLHKVVKPNEDDCKSSLSRMQSITSVGEPRSLFSIYSNPNEDIDEDQEEDSSMEESSVRVGTANMLASAPLFLARGLGIDRVASGLLTAGVGGGCGGGNCGVVTGGNGGGDKGDIESYYRRVVEENPHNALFLSNYAQFLHQVKGDCKRAEEYYSRAILADPSDGQNLSEYAKLIWKQHRDEERASSYFQQAVQAAPSNSHVHAAYAGFLWETEEEDVDAGIEGAENIKYSGAFASASA